MLLKPLLWLGVAVSSLLQCVLLSSIVTGEFWIGSPSIWLDDLFINEEERSKGGGLQLMNAIIKEASIFQASHLYWTASINNLKVQQFYQQFGAKIERTDDSLLYYKLVM